MRRVYARNTDASNLRTFVERATSDPAGTHKLPPTLTDRSQPALAAFKPSCLTSRAANLISRAASIPGNPPRDPPPITAALLRLRIDSPSRK